MLDLRALVEQVRRQTEIWLNSMQPESSERPRVERLRNLTESLLIKENIPLAAMEQLRIQLCECCRRLHAGESYKDCKGRALGHCPILIAQMTE